MILLLSALSILFGQAAIKSSGGPAEGTIRVEKKLVLVPVSVLDDSNRPILGLEQCNFRVFDNKLEQSIESFSTADEPIAVGLVFDVSGSMARKLPYARTAVKAFFDTANSADEFLLVQFNGAPRVTVPLTGDIHAIEARLASADPRGKTALLDAVHLGVNEIRKSKLSRKALLIVSDGGDNHSRYREKEIGELARESDVPIYAIGVYDALDTGGSTPEELAGPGLLKEIAEQTGGWEYSVGYVRELNDAAIAVGAALRNLYVLGFSPSSGCSGGGYHNLRVRVVGVRSPAPIAFSRPGYYSAPTDIAPAGRVGNPPCIRRALRDR